jgi:hypothetical protein
MELQFLQVTTMYQTPASGSKGIGETLSAEGRNWRRWKNPNGRLSFSG